MSDQRLNAATAQFRYVFDHPTARGRFKEGMSIGGDIYRKLAEEVIGEQEALRNALSVIVFDPSISHYLSENDPKALAQAQAALGPVPWVVLVDVFDHGYGDVDVEGDDQSMHTIFVTAPDRVEAARLAKIEAIASLTAGVEDEPTGPFSVTGTTVVLRSDYFRIKGR